jgi:hypothetical protein
MVSMRSKTPRSHNVLLLLTLVITLFGRNKKQTQEDASFKTDTVSFPIPDSLKKSISTNDAGKARDQLRLANFEREILGDVMTKIYEAEAKGELKESEKNLLVQRYKSDLKRVDSEIENQRKVVDLYELESAKEELLKSFHEKLLEIDLKISQIQPNTVLSLNRDNIKTSIESQPSLLQKIEPKPQTTTSSEVKEKSTPTTVRERPKNKAEERIDAVREEVLKAMERLEQIESEG